MPYLLYVDDNYHFMDESERTGPKTFATYEAALAEARSIVDDFLANAYKPGMSAGELYRSYTGFGDDPFIVCREVPEPPVKFSAWDYASKRCTEICGPGDP